MGASKRLLEELEQRRTRRYKCPDRVVESDIEGCGEYDLHIEHDGYAECLSCGAQFQNKEAIEKIWDEGDYEGHHSEDEIATRGW